MKRRKQPHVFDSIIDMKTINVLTQPVAYLGGPLGHAPFWQKKFLWPLEKIGKPSLAPLCVSTSGQRKLIPFMKS